MNLVTCHKYLIYHKKLTYHYQEAYDLIFVQAFAQIKDKYGDSYDAIMDACQNKVYIMATQEDTQKEFSSMIGNQQITVQSRSGETDSLKSSITENQEERPLLRYDELAHLKEGETVVVRNLKRQDKKKKQDNVISNI